MVWPLSALTAPPFAPWHVRALGAQPFVPRSWPVSALHALPFHPAVRCPAPNYSLLVWAPHHAITNSGAIQLGFARAAVAASAAAGGAHEAACLNALASAPCRRERDHVRLTRIPVPRQDALAWVLGYEAAVRRVRSLLGWRALFLVSNRPLTSSGAAAALQAAAATQEDELPVGSQGHYDLCPHCQEGGELLMCGGCAYAAHRRCIGIPHIPHEEWFCDKCLTAPPPLRSAALVPPAAPQAAPTVTASTPRAQPSGNQRVATQLRVGTLNATGLSSVTCADLATLLPTLQIDILAITESWEGAPCKGFAIPGFRWFGRRRRGGAQHGGVGFFVAEGLLGRMGFGVQRPQLEESLWLKLSGAGRGQRALCLGVVYLPTDNQPAEIRQAAFAALRADITSASVVGEVAVLGDFNARVGQGTGAPDARVGPHMCDTHRNANGRLLLDLLSSLDMYAMNGRSVEGGQFTYEHPSGSSCVDFVLVQRRLLEASRGTMRGSPKCELVVHPAAIHATAHRLLHMPLPAPAPRNPQRRMAQVKVVPRLALLRSNAPVPTPPGAPSHPAHPNNAPLPTDCDT